MPDFNIRVIVDPTAATAGITAVEGGLASLEAEANTLNETLMRAFEFLAVEEAIRHTLELANEYVELKNRLGSVTESAAEFNAVQSEIFRVSQQTRTAVNDNIGMYQRYNAAMHDMGHSSQETINFIKGLAEETAVAGAGAAEQTRAMSELGHAILTGSVNARTFRSIMMNVPQLMQAVGQHFHLTAGKMAEMAHSGRLTGEMLVQTFMDADGKIAAAFARTTPTLEQAFTVFKNAAEFAIGQWAQSSGVFKAVTDAMIWMGQNITIVGNALTGLALILGVNFAVWAVGAAIDGLAALGAAFMSNPIGMIVEVLTIAIALLISFSNQMNYTAGSAAKLSDVFGVVWGDLIHLLQQAVTMVGQFFGVLQQSTQSIDWGKLATGAAHAVDQVLTFFSKMGSTIKFIWDHAWDLIKDTAVRAINAMIGFWEGAINAILEGGANLFGAQNLINIPRLREQATSAASAIAQAWQSSPEIHAAIDYLNSVGQRAAAAALARQHSGPTGGVDLTTHGANTGGEGASATHGKTFQDIIDHLTHENTLLGLNNRERQIRQQLFQAEEDLKRHLTPEETQRLTTLARENQLLQDQADILDKVNGPAEDWAATQQALNTLLSEGQITLEQYNQQLDNSHIQYLQAQTDAASGFQRFMIEMRQQARVTGDDIYGFLKDTFSKTADALVQFVETGKLNFRDLFKSIVEDFIKMGVEHVLSELVSGGGGGGGGGGWAAAIPAILSIFGFANGGIMGANGPMALRRYAYGGVASGPQLAMFGEGSQPEAYVPLPDGRSIPVAMKGGNSGGISIGAINIDARGADSGVDVRIRRALEEAAPVIVATAREGAVSDVTNLLTRRRTH